MRVCQNARNLFTTDPYFWGYIWAAVVTWKRFFYLFQEILKNESNRTLDKHKYLSQKVNVELKQSCTEMPWKNQDTFSAYFF